MKRIRKNRRRGASAVEFALVAPLFFALFFGIIEFGRVMMVQQLLTNASRSGAREAALPESTLDSVRAIVIEQLANASISVSPEDIVASPNPSSAVANQQITVEVSVPYSEVGWVSGDFFSGRLRASTSMRAERMN